ncbi:MAG: hypothetical protein DIZ77_05260 [endosymbiont of Seepiophila jonesi]|uniref:histidine kinase n=1 Tax=endosymbiont of Lamellibrachia luymesi TaxID=2200907 RepID=A0A370DSY2_9GAMM|nr:MAG: hypothetical protein DIZ79_14805 [endosymbiont of Lamellibrachia luymesi]RDH93662.1 MAG: hypothetical protein DIZ77_05260 [endosymbiont of Seepiophila jonesi]
MAGNTSGRQWKIFHNASEWKMPCARVRQTLHRRRPSLIWAAGIWHLDIINDQLNWSKETYQIFGIEVDSPVSLGNFVAALHLEDTDRVLDAWDAAQLGAPYDIEHRIIADGKEKWVRERAEIHFNDRGQVISALV